MIHEMSLYEDPFEKIKGGRKSIEVRLYDEKRRKVNVGDAIVFRKLPDKSESLRVVVVGYSVFGSFRDLFMNFDKSKFGHPENISIDDQIKLSRQYYTEDKEKEYGVMGIHIKLAD
ncbi:ASCH family RNA-binding protein [Candidatus Mancarchaeum acidiphilum]|uniref:ASCH family RNA-binding protein n=1 Tax=Candidatus Mancarchaeum acidiphilum TaxID=1920749 RepID=A0A218NMK7_9ARCH|nr:ASCH domain-containing protein [Candidatus Mancarchaeum acidiphilum]ASI13692.1 ASCH family RNA-binding protein [Candidatus Mancarchaeum acidiphilum]